MKKKPGHTADERDERIASLERKLEQAETRWRNTIEHAPQIGVSLSTDGTIVFANRHFLDLTGWELEEIQGRDWFEHFLPDDVRESVRDIFRTTVSKGDVGPHSLHTNAIVTRDGSVRDIAWYNVTTTDDDGTVHNITSLGVDLTEREEVETALRVSEERLSLALEASRDAVWDWNPQTRETYFSPQWYGMLGYDPAKISNRVDTWKELAHPDDREQAEWVITNAIKDGETFEFECRMRTSSGEWKWILSKGKVVATSDGGIRLIGTHSDINDRKLAELALKNAKEVAEEANNSLRLYTAHLRTLVETIPELVWLKDTEGRYILCNKRFERLYGASEAEIVGRNDYDFVDRELAEFFRGHDRAAMEAGRPLMNEETLQYKDDGHVEELETIKSPMYDDQGELIGVLGVARDITRRNRIAEELRESELRFKALHNASFGGIAIHQDGHILDCNQGLVDISGYTRDDLVGMDGLGLIAPSHREMVREAMNLGYEKAYEALGLRKDGDIYPLRLEARNIPYKGRMVRAVEFRDISRRKKAEQELQDSEQRHRVIFESSPLGMVRLSEEGYILDCNAMFGELMAVPREKMIGFNILGRSNPKMRAALEKAILGEPSSYEDYYTSVTSGKRSYLHIQFNPVNEGHPPTEVIATVEDFGARKAAQDELERARDEAEAFSRSKTEFLANMSHEIRTPLNGVLGTLQLLQDTVLDEEQAGYTKDAIQSSRRLTRLLSDILDLSRVEAGKLMVQSVPFNLKETCTQVCDLYRLTSAQSGVEMVCDIDGAIPSSLIGDPLRVQQILTNLIGNSFKFTRQGRIELHAVLLPVSDDRSSRVLLIVSDTGKGIPSEKVDSLFETFTQLGGGYSRQHQGAGLGLAICRQLVRLMGGTIAVDSEPGKGTAVYVSLPLEVDQGTAGQRPQPVRTMECASGDALKILLAEDERVNSMVTRRMLEKAGHEVVDVDNGQKAIEAASKERFDVILMDIQMPVMDGITATREIRQGAAGEENKDIPIAAVTAFAMVGDREKFIAAGMDGYVVKPVELGQLNDFLGTIRQNCDK